MKVDTLMRAPEVVLKEAAALIREHQWVQGSWGVRGERRERYCVMHAVAATTGAVFYKPMGGCDYAMRIHGNDPEFATANALLKDRIVARYGEKWRHHPNHVWNDEDGRTVEQVLEVLEEG